ncbi:hypothetical protein E7T06_17705 [Deinococcus sp. Arct2-2]|uniref:hypothetical protein n=1 Tax=Deinococcus sp. Arct2-2 TaxID=2568653 RepID=UPI0010A47721|nr:hypothetical protein [Deinococcus sp. Arct2-2]THF68169.1 hypothetical protein E7T06_17705 [Deinococcus sp. Arct2-2]
MTTSRIRIGLVCALLTAAPTLPASAQTLPPVVIRSPAMARGALQEVNVALQGAIRSGRRDELKKALQRTADVTGTLNELGYTGLQKEVGVTLGLYHDAIAALLRALTASCEKGNLPDGLTGADILRSLGPATVKGVGTQRINDIQARLPKCLALTLQIDSGIKASAMNYVVHVEVVVPLDYDLQGGFYRGKGQITVLSQQATPEGPCQGKFDNDPADFIVNRLDVQTINETRLEKIVLKAYQVGQLKDTGVLVCPAPAPAIPIRQMNWTTLFQGARMKRDLSALDWRFGFPANIVASTRIDGPFAEYLSEATDILLRRTPR